MGRVGVNLSKIQWYADQNRGRDCGDRDTRGI